MKDKATLLPQVIELKKKGTPHSVISDLLGIGRCTITRWLKDEFGEGYVSPDEAKTRQLRVRRIQETKAGNRAKAEREELATQATTWQPKIKPYRRGQ